jgi:phenylacetate-CoA ligase
MDNLRTALSYVARSAYFSAKGYAVAALKNGPEFQRFLADLEQSQWYSADRLRDMQDQKVRALIRHAYDTVPYYKRLFNAHGLRPSEVTSVDHLRKIPVLTKDMLRANAPELISTAVPRRSLFSGWTTGSTGTPINALRTHTSVAFEHATIWRQRRWAGIELKARKAAVWGTIWNNVIIPSSLPKRPPYWRYNAADNQLLFSYYHMSDETLPDYFDKLEEFRPAFIEGFPSTILVLANFLRRRGRYFPVRAIFTSSEPLYEVHRREIEERFRTRVFDLYGQAERVSAATECEAHSGLHVNPEYGVLEVLRDGGDAGPGESGELIGTGLNNFGMPLIRYQTGDIGRVAALPCPCGRAMPLLESVQGRLVDCIQTPDGRKIPGDGIMGAFHGVANIRRSQIIQEDLATLVVRIERDNPEAPVDTRALQRNLQTCLGSEMRIAFDVVRSIEVHIGSKFRWVISHVTADPIHAPEEYV